MQSPTCRLKLALTAATGTGVSCDLRPIKGRGLLPEDGVDGGGGHGGPGGPGEGGGHPAGGGLRGHHTGAANAHCGTWSPHQV